MDMHDRVESPEKNGSVPGWAAQPAYTLRASVLRIPVLIAVPHGGRCYPPGLIAAMRNPAYASIRLEDRYVDRLALEVARGTGAALLVAHAPRAMIDLNRAPDDIDWEMFHSAPSGWGVFPRPGRRARSGLGLFPRRLPGLGELWKQRFDAAVVGERLDAIHRPYHAALSAALERLRERWGAALLIDLHSMPPLTPVHPGETAAEIVIGDRFGVSCDDALVGAAFAHLAASGCRAAHNRPYAGGYVLERHASTRRGIHALQLEIDRRCYLDERLSEPGPTFTATVGLLSKLIRRLAQETTFLASRRADRDWDQGLGIAAE